VRDLGVLFLPPIDETEHDSNSRGERAYKTVAIRKEQEANAQQDAREAEPM
jgi:hypothetical protein